jgi:hypothetical protein
MANLNPKYVLEQSRIDTNPRIKQLQAEWFKASKAFGAEKNKKTRTALQTAYDALHGELDKSIRHVTNGMGTLLVPSGKYWKLTKHPKGIQIEVTDQPAARGLPRIDPFTSQQ